MTKTMKIEEWVKEATREELEEQVIHLNKIFLAYDSFLMNELGEETYNDIVQRFALEQSTGFLKELGMSDEEIAEFEEMMQEKENPKN